MKAIRFLSVISAIALAMIVILEILSYAIARVSSIHLVDRDGLASFTHEAPDAINKANPVYIPHPYFGYVYVPNSQVSQLNGVTNKNVIMKTNSEGFIDREFPTERKAGECVYGLMGASAAMSWGVDSDEERISHHLENLLNAELTNDTCRHYRILNMGIGSHTFYQTTQVFLYYGHVLDGAIFFGGFGECAQSAMIGSRDPIRYPVLNLYAAWTAPTPILSRIIDEKEELSSLAKFFLRYGYFSWSPTARLIFAIKVRELLQLNAQLQEAIKTPQEFPSIQGKLKKSLREEFPGQTPLTLMHSYDSDNPAIPQLLKRILPLVYTDPLEAAFSVARSKNIRFLSIIEPMIYVLGSDPDWRKLMIASYSFQDYCVKGLIAEGKELERTGLKTINLNDVDREQYRRNFFFDQVHLTPAGTKFVAQELFEAIKREWR